MLNTNMNLVMGGIHTTNEGFEYAGWVVDWSRVQNFASLNMLIEVPMGLGESERKLR